MTSRWQVQIVNPATGRPQTWKMYAERELAEVEAAKLRVWKMFAQVRRVDDEDPEPCGVRRRSAENWFLDAATFARDGDAASARMSALRGCRALPGRGKS